MTTEATQQPQTPQPPVMDVAEVYRTLGRLEEGQQQAREHLARIEQRFDRYEEVNNQRLDRHEELNNQRLDRHEELNNQQFERHEVRNEQRYLETNKRIDRLWYTIVGGSIAILAGMAGLAVQNALMG